MSNSMRISVWLLASIALALFLGVGVARLSFPLPLHPVEGAMMEQVLRLADDKPLYAAPSLQYIPLPMMPGFTAAASLLARQFDPGLWQIRLIGILASLLVVALIIRVLKNETQSWTLAVAGAGLFLLASGGVTGAYDLGRPELFALLFVMVAFTYLRSTKGRVSAVWAALMFAVGFFVQMEMAWFALAAGVHLLIHDRRRLPFFAVTLAIVCIGGYLGLARAWPWFDFYTWDVPANALRPDVVRIATDLRDLLLRGFGVLSVASLMAFATPRRPWMGADGIWLWFAAAGLVSGLTAASEPWSGGHAWLPLVLGLSVFGPIAVTRLVAHLATWPGSSRTAGQGIMVALLTLQLFGLLHGTEGLLPSPEARVEWTRYQAWLRQQPGTLLAPGHGYVTWLAEREPAFNTYALDQVMSARGNRLLREDPSYFDHMIGSLRAGADRPMLLTEAPLAESGGLFQALDTRYELLRTPPELTHWRSENEGPRLPTYLYRPIAPEPIAAEPETLGTPGASATPDPSATPQTIATPQTTAGVTDP